MIDWPIHTWRIRAHRSPSSFDSIGVYAVIRTSEHDAKIINHKWPMGLGQADEIALAEYAPNDWIAPSFNLSEAKAQVLIDSLWESGLRPTAGHGSAGAMAATEKHLNDMRALVSHHTKAKLP